jgi:hypothetical protein
METKILKKFQPLSQDATNRINELIKRNGKLIVETKTHVEIQRYESIAKIDQWGRVEWRSV